MTTMASTHSFTPVLALFSLAAMLATGCGSKSNTEDTGVRQGSGSCYTYENNGTESCASYYGYLADPTQNEPHCNLVEGEWRDEDCPGGFWGWCDLETVPDNGIETYFYGEVNWSAQGTCEALGGGIWHE
jgi:hypothetical protein